MCTEADAVAIKVYSNQLQLGPMYLPARHWCKRQVWDYNRTLIHIIAERLSARQLIVQRSQFAFVCMYVYPSHFNCVGAVSVVSSPDY